MSDKKQWKGFHRGRRVAGHVIMGIIGAVIFGLLFGFLVMYLWNWLMPAIFGLGTITYIQAFGLVVLSKILFGSFGHGHWHSRHNDEYRFKLMMRGRNGKGGDIPQEIAEHREEFDRYWSESGRGHFEEYMKRIDGNE
jgi:MFS family permease